MEDSVDTIKGNVTKLQEDDQKGWKADFGEKFKLNGTFQASYTGDLRKGGDNYPNNFRIPHAELNLSGKLYPHIDYRIGLETDMPTFDQSNGILGDAYIATDIIPHHTVYFGQSRVPIGYEGAQEYGETDAIERSMISRYFSNERDLGVKVKGNWDFIDYSVGAFNGNLSNKYDTNNDMSIATWAVIKPLYKYPKCGKMELGGGYKTGKYNSARYDYISFLSYYNENIDTISAYGSYKYKKYAIRGEFASNKVDRDYYNHRINGWYLHNSYDLTRKIQLIARYDQLNPFNDDLGYYRITEYAMDPKNWTGN